MSAKDATDTVATSSGATSVRWSAMAVIGRQLSQMLCALVLARILGPSTYGIISAATVYVTLSTLVMDQGLASALVQSPRLGRLLPGAVACANLLAGLVLAVATWLLAPLVAAFFSVPGLTPLLRVLGAGLLLKAAAITPRAMQQRRLRFKILAVADIAGGSLGAVAGIAAALTGAGTWSMAWQVIGTDLVIAAILLAVTRGAAPNLALRELRSILPFSLRVFASSGLAFFSRNADNILVGRFLGVTALSQYSMAYRVLVIPVQMIGQTVNRVAFPTFSRLTADPERLASNLVKVTELLAMAAVPPMIFAAVASPDLIQVVLGASWSATAPVLTVLAIAGARETVINLTNSLMRAKGLGKLIFRYEILATASQLAGIVIGLQFGVFGVAVGYASAGFLLTPVLMVIQRRLAGVKVRKQVRSILPAVHASLWGCAGYLTLRHFESDQLVVLLGGFGIYLVAAGAVLWIVHRAALRRTAEAGASILGLRPRRGSGAVMR